MGIGSAISYLVYACIIGLIAWGAVRLRRPNEPEIAKNTEYPAQWREKYLRARIDYLKKKIIENKGVPSNPVIPNTDTQKKLIALNKWVIALEKQLKSLK